MQQASYTSDSEIGIDVRDHLVCSTASTVSVLGNVDKETSSRTVRSTQDPSLLRSICKPWLSSFQHLGNG